MKKIKREGRMKLNKTILVFLSFRNETTESDDNNTYLLSSSSSTFNRFFLYNDEIEALEREREKLLHHDSHMSTMFPTKHDFS